MQDNAQNAKCAQFFMKIKVYCYKYHFLEELTFFTKLKPKVMETLSNEDPLIEAYFDVYINFENQSRSIL